MDSLPLAELIVAIAVGARFLIQPEPVGCFHPVWRRWRKQSVERVENDCRGREALFQGQVTCDFQGFQAVGAGQQQQFDKGFIASLLLEESDLVAGADYAVVYLAGPDLADVVVIFHR